MSHATPGSLINHLITYINDDSAIVAYVKREFGAVMTVDDIKRKRRLRYQPKQYKLEPLADGEQHKWEKRARASDSRMVARLTKVVGA